MQIKNWLLLTLGSAFIAWKRFDAWIESFGALKWLIAIILAMLLISLMLWKP